MFQPIVWIRFGWSTLLGKKKRGSYLKLKRPMLAVEMLEGRITPAAPIATDIGPLSLLHGTSVAISLASNVSDPDSDPLSVSIVQAPSHGSLSFDSWSNQYYFTPTGNYTGPDSFTFKANDNVLDSNTATVSINVTDQAPVATDIGPVSVLHGQSTSFDLAANVSDPDGETPAASIVQQPAHGYFSIDYYTGAYIYHADYNYTGPDSFTFKANDNVLDSNVATASINVTDQAPVATDIGPVSVLHGQSTTFDLAANVSDPDDETPTVSIVQQPAHGYFSIDYYTGAYIYHADYNYTGPDSFTFKANDNVLDSNVATVSINVTDQAPIATDIASTSVLHGQSTTFDLAAHVSDSDDETPTVSVVQQPTHGYLYLDYYTGNYIYIANYNYTGPDSFTFKANDNVFDSNVATASIDVTDQAPVATDIALTSVLHGQSTTFVLASNVSDPDGETPIVSVVQQPTHGYLYIDYYTGNYIYVANYNYTGPDSFTFKANDNVLDSNTATVSIDVTDQAPVATDIGPVSLLHGQSTSFSLASNVSDPDGETPTVSIDQEPSHGDLYFNSYTGLYVYTADVNYIGSDSFTFKANDGALDSNTATASINVTDQAPVATDIGPLFVLQGASVPISLASNVSDPDGDPLSVSIVQQPTHGSLFFDSYSNQYYYTANATYAGPDSFTFKANDGLLDSAEATVSIVVNSVPASINSLLLDNYLADYSELDPDGDTPTASNDVVTAQLEPTNPGGDTITFRYVWSVYGQVVQTDETANVVDTLDLTQIGDGLSGADVSVAVTLLDGGQAVSQAAADIADQSAPSGPVWASPSSAGFVGPLAPPAAPTFVYPAGTSSFSFTTSEGAPQDMVIGQIATSGHNPSAYSIVGGNANGWVKIDAAGNLKVAVESLPLTSTLQFTVTVAAADSANPGLLANQARTVVIITLKPTVVITGDFQAVAAPVGGGEDNIDLKFVRVTNDLSALTVLYTIDWNGINPTARLANSADLANTLPNAGQVSFAAGQSVVDVVLVPTATFSAAGEVDFNVQLDTPAAGDGYVIPPHNTSFFIPSLTMTGYDNAKVYLYDGTCLFASSNGTAGLADAGDSANMNDLDQGSLGDCFFLAAVGAIAKSNPQFIHDLIQDNGDGTATVNFYPTVGAAAVPIEVSMSIDAGYSQADLSGDYRMSADGTHREWEIWPQVLEKAYAFFIAAQGGNINNGGTAYIVWQQLTGAAAQTISTAGMTASAIAASVDFSYAAGAKIVVSSNSTIANPIATVEGLNYEIVTGHAYVLLRIWEDDDGDEYMELFNPWGGDPNAQAATTNIDGPITKPILEVPLLSFNTYFYRFQYQF